MQRVTQWARELKAGLSTLYLAYRDPRTPWYARAGVWLVLAYALSPLDLIPDFVPVLGYLDDVILLPLGIVLVLRLIPAAVWTDSRARSASGAALPANWERRGACLVVSLWLVVIVIIGWWIVL